MKEKLQKIRERAIAEIESSDGLEKLGEVRNTILGKKGELTAVLKGMKDVPPEDRPKVGQWVDETREAIETILAELAKQHGIDMPMDQLLVKAEAFAIRAGGRSPRVAKQFIEQCEAGVQK